MTRTLALLAGALLLALTAVACNDGPAPPADQPDAGPADACTSNAVLVTAHQAEIGLDAWEWARNNPYLAPDGRGGVFVTFRGLQERPYAQRLEHFDRSGRRLLGTRDAPYVVCPAALQPGLGVMIADGAGGLFMSVWLEEPRTGIRRSQIQRLGPDGAPLWAAQGSDFGVNVLASDNPPTADSIGGDVALVLLPTGDGGVAVYFRLYGSRGTFLQVFDAHGNRRWADRRLAFVPPDWMIDSPYVANRSDGDGGFWVEDFNADSGDATKMPRFTLFAQHYTHDGEAAFLAPGVTVADGIFSNHAEASAWPDGAGGYLLLYGNHLEPIGLRAESWPEALFAARVAPSGELLWGAGVPLTTTMTYIHSINSRYPTEAQGLPDGRGGLLVGWPEDRDGDGRDECYGQYVAPDGTLAAPANGIALGGGAELLCSAMNTYYLPWFTQSADGDQVFAVLQEDETAWHGPWRLAFQKLHRDLTARWGPAGAFAMACEPDPRAEHGVWRRAWLDQVEGVVADAEGGVYAAWSTADRLWLVHVTADGQTDWTP